MNYNDVLEQAADRWDLIVRYALSAMVLPVGIKCPDRGQRA